MRRPEWTRSIRFRMTLLYSSVLFALAALLVGSLYLGLSLSLRNEPLSREQAAQVFPGEPLADRRAFERTVNERTLRNLRTFSFGALGALFVASLGVGWVIAGRVLAPIERISGVARQIQATNLSRRIELTGPDDELRRLADTFDAMLARLDAAFEAQRRFVADASHELRNPLATIQANLDVALADPHPSTGSLRETAVVVRRASTRMARLVDDLLALARLEAPTTRREPVELGALVREVADEFRAPAGRRGLRLEHAAADAPTVEGDREGLKRALANLVDNAVRAAPPGSPVRLAVGSDGGRAWMAVADEGPGIAPDQQGRIFDRFARLDGGRSRAEGGSGLGLAIVRELAEAHGGSVEVASRPGHGATFTIWL